MNEEEQQPNQLQEPQTQSTSTQASEPTEFDHANKPIVKLCAACEHIGQTGYERISTLNASEQVIEELKAIHAQVVANKRNYSFTHGNCGPHYMQSVMQMPNVSVDKIKAAKNFIKTSPNVMPCLVTDDALRHAYARGLFTKEQIEKAAEEIKQSNQNLTERFKKLAGIIK